MSDININGIPNLGFAGGGGGIIGGSAAGGIPAMSADQINQSMWGRFSPQQAQIPLQNNFNNFGLQTDYYSALGAAYGRNTGGFRGGGSVFDPNVYHPAGEVERGDDLAPITGDGGSDGMDPGMNGGGGGGGGGVNMADYLSRYGLNARGAGALYGTTGRTPGGGGGMGSVFDPSTYEPRVDIGGYFNQLTDNGGQHNAGPTQPEYDPYSPDTYQGGVHTGGGRLPWNPSAMRLLGYDPNTSGQFAPSAGNQLANRFGNWGPNVGTPSQYYTGSQHPNAQLPPGFSELYGADNPGGALPLGYKFDMGNGGG